MKLRSTAVSLAILLAAMACSKKEVPAPTAVLPVPSAAQLEWHEMETNAFVHFTTNTYTGLRGYGNEKESIFNPTNLDADQWVTTPKDAGFKNCNPYLQTPRWLLPVALQYTEHSIKNSPYKDGKGDIVKEVSEACKRHGLKFGIYLSPWDRNRADYGKPEYITYYRNQLKELFTSYGPVFEMWFDGANGGDGFYGGANEKRTIDRKTYYDWPTTINLVKEMEPNIILFSDAGPGVRWGGNENGTAGETNWNTITPDTLHAGKAGVEHLLNTGAEGGTHWIPAEIDVSIRPGWFYHDKEDSLVKSPERLFEIYLTSVGRGSTLLLNVPPDKRGLMHDNDIAALKGWKAMIDNEFKTNLAANVPTTASSFRGEAEQYNAAKATDGDKETYWATDDAVTTGNIEMNLGEVKPVKYVTIQEYIKLGQRVKSFTIEVWKDNAWTKVAEGTTVGYKRIMKLDNVSTDKVRVSITGARACPLISNVAVY